MTNPVSQVNAKKTESYDSSFNKAWMDAEQIFYVAQAEADRMGVPPPKPEEVVGHLFQLRESLGKETDIFHDVLADELAKLKKEESKC